MARSGTDAIKWGRAQVSKPSQDWYRWCLKYVRMSFGLPGGTPDAGKAWDWAKYKHRTSDSRTIPAGVPVFWELPSVADHVALSTGNGMCLSNDIKRRGKIDEVPIDLITRSWGGQLLGWTEDLNGVRIWSGTVPQPPKKPTVDLSRLVEAAKRDPKLPQGGTTYPAGVKIVERALKDEGFLPSKYAADGSYGSLTVGAYSKFQKKLGYKGKDADGIPGLTSLRRLGEKYGFTVIK